MSKMSLEFDGFKEVIARLEKLQGDVRGATEKALTETHSIVTKKAEESARKENLPAKGEYSNGGTLDSLKRDATIKWSGTLASVEVGFNIEEGGLPSIFMMHGTPRNMKNQKMYDAFYGKVTQNEVKQAQENVFYDEIRKIGG